MADADIRIVEPGGEGYRATVALRREVLLDPFGIDWELAGEDDGRAVHVAVFEPAERWSSAMAPGDTGAVQSSGTCLGCLMLVPRGAGQVQMRQVAVAPQWQRKGLGRHLVQWAENWAQKQGFEKMLAHARHSAVPFYRAMGYRVVGPPYQEVGLEHRTVEKGL